MQKASRVRRHHSLSKEITILEDFAVKHLYEKPGQIVHEMAYQFSRQIAFNNRALKSCTAVVKKVLKRFVRHIYRMFRSIDIHSTGECLYAFEAHWKRSESLFSRVFQPILCGEEVMHCMFGRLFVGFIQTIKARLSEYLIQFISKDIKARFLSDTCVENENISGYSYSAVNNWEETRPDSYKDTGCEKSFFMNLQTNERILILINMLKQRGVFWIVSEKIVNGVISMYMHEIERRKLELSDIRHLVDSQRAIEYLRDDFYSIESGLMKKVVEGISEEEVFRVFKEGKEVLFLVNFFCISDERDKLYKIIKAYHEEMFENVETENFFLRYYMTDLELRILKCREEEENGVRDYIRRCRKEVVDFYAKQVLEGVCGWIDVVLRGETHIDRDGNWLKDKNPPRIRLEGHGEAVKHEIRNIAEEVKVWNFSVNSSAWRCNILFDISNVVRNIFLHYDDKNVFELLLRKKLASRLLSGIYTSLEDEKIIISAMNVGGTMYSHKMRGMLEDFSGVRKMGDSNVLLLRTCKWPEFKNVSLGIKDVQEFQKKYEKTMIKSERKKILWNDMLSSCDIEILGVPITVTLTQYAILCRLVERPRKEEEIRVYESWNIHLRMLMENGLVYIGGNIYYLNTKWDVNRMKSSFIPRELVFEDSRILSKCFDESESLKDILDCKIMRAMKANKRLSLDKLRGIVGEEFSQEILCRRIDNLFDREFLYISNGVVEYIP